MPRDGSVLGLGRPLADHDLIGHKARPATSPRARDAQRPAGAQAGGQLLAQRSPSLHIQRLIDRLMRDPHRLIIGEVQTQPMRDLLRAPGPPPPPVLARPMTPPDPPDLRARDRAPIRPLHSPRQAVGHIAAQLRVAGELGSPAAPVGVPLRSRCPMVSEPLRVAALRRNSREIVDGDRPTRRAISRTPSFWARSSAISSRSTNDK